MSGNQIDIGIVFRPQSPPEELRAMVAETEDAGVAELWLWEDCFREGGIAAAAAALSWSSHLRVGLGLLPVPLRNPALAAMEIATVARLWPERFVATLGHGMQEWMAQAGGRVESPMTLLHEHVVAIRRLLDGEEVTVGGRYVQLDQVKLAWPPPRRPELIIGARGPRTIALAGAEADGVLLDTTTNVSTVRRARDILDEARASSGRTGRSKVYAYTAVDTTKDPASLTARLTEWVAALKAAGADVVLVHGSDDQPHGREIVRLLRRESRTPQR